MKRSRFTEDQIFSILKEADAGDSVKEICRRQGIRWAHLGLGLSLLALACGDDQRPDTTPPAAVTDLAVVGITRSSVSLTWTAPENTGESGPAEAYDLRYSHQPADQLWETATPVDSLPAPAEPGTQEDLTVSGLMADSLYSFALRSRDAAGNWSGFSNLIWVQPADTIPPAPILDLALRDVTPTTATLTWTAPGDDGLQGTVARYEVRRAPTEITLESWEEATLVSTSANPVLAASTATTTDPRGTV